MLGQDIGNDRHLLDAISDLVIEIKPDGSLLYANHSWMEAKGYNLASMPLLRFEEVLLPCALNPWRDCLNHLREGARPNGVALELVAQSGQHLTCEANFYPRRDAEGALS